MIPDVAFKCNSGSKLGLDWGLFYLASIALETICLFLKLVCLF